MFKPTQWREWHEEFARITGMHPSERNACGDIYGGLLGARVYYGETVELTRVLGQECLVYVTEEQGFKVVEAVSLGIGAPFYQQAAPEDIDVDADDESMDETPAEVIYQATSEAKRKAPIGFFRACLRQIEGARFDEYLTWVFEIVDGPYKGREVVRVTQRVPTPDNDCGDIYGGLLGRKVDREEIDEAFVIDQPCLIYVAEVAGYVHVEAVSLGIDAETFAQGEPTIRRGQWNP